MTQPHTVFEHKSKWTATLSPFHQVYHPSSISTCALHPVSLLSPRANPSPVLWAHRVLPSGASACSSLPSLLCSLLLHLTASSCSAYKPALVSLSFEIKQNFLLSITASSTTLPFFSQLHSKIFLKSFLGSLSPLPVLAFFLQPTPVGLLILLLHWGHLAKWPVTSLLLLFSFSSPSQHSTGLLTSMWKCFPWHP